MTVTSVMPNLYTADMARAITFYRDLLGGTQTFATPAEGTPEHVEFRLGDVIVALSSREAVPRQGLPAATTGHPMELVIDCDSTDDTVAALRAAGTPVLVEPHNHASGHRRAYVADPDGNWIALVSRQSA
jgi:lactoylglutathione lyase